MLRVNAPLTSLHQRLAQVLTHLRLDVAGPFGKPEAIEHAAKEAERVFQGFAKAKPSEARVYEVARAFMRQQTLDEFERHLLACGLSLRIKEAQQAMPLGHSNFRPLLARFEAELDKGDLWRLTWFNLLVSYFAFSPLHSSAKEIEGFSQLQAFLERTWPILEAQNRGRIAPEWVTVLRRDRHVLAPTAAQRYAADYLAGKDDAVNALATELGIPESSWFWHSLVKHCVSHATTTEDDRAFRAAVPRLIGLIRQRPAFRDKSIAALLERCARGQDKSPLPALRDYVVARDVWKNPKLKSLGRAPAWNNVSEPAWTMAVGWVNEGLLRDFFQILAGRHGTDEGRLDFWSRYIDQISWTRLCIGSHTRMLTNRPEIRALIAREEGAYARIARDLDAFIAQIGRYIVVEFSTTGNAAYIYDSSKAPFDLNAEEYVANTADLKRGFHGDHVIRATHTPGWQALLEHELKRIGIHPDADRSTTGPSAVPPLRRIPASTAAASGTSNLTGARSGGAPFTLSSLRELVGRYPRAQVVDDRKPDGRGRLRVLDPSLDRSLEHALLLRGFVHGSTRGEYFYPAS